MRSAHALSNSKVHLVWNGLARSRVRINVVQKRVASRVPLARRRLDRNFLSERALAKAPVDLINDLVLQIGTDQRAGTVEKLDILAAEEARNK